jgi:hypothetical protein
MVENIFSPLEVKNKPHEGESEYAFIFVSMDCMVMNNNFLVKFTSETKLSAVSNEVISKY